MLRRGDVLGELALLREGTRSVSARARRDTELIELGRGELRGADPGRTGFALGLTRAMGAQLAASRTPVVAATPPQTIAVVGLDRDSPSPRSRRDWPHALAAHGSVARLSGGELATIDQAERDADRVVLESRVGSRGRVDRRCVREAHLVVAVTSGTARPGLACSEDGAAGLRAVRPRPSGVRRASSPSFNHARSRSSRTPGCAVAALEATARRLAQRSLGIVLSGGGARALAHLGVIEELSAAGCASVASPG